MSGVTLARSSPAPFATARAGARSAAESKAGPSDSGLPSGREFRAARRMAGVMETPGRRIGQWRPSTARPSDGAVPAAARARLGQLTQRLQHCVRVLVGSRGLQSFIHGARQGVHGRRPVTDPRGRSLDRPDADGRLSRNHGQDASNLPGRLSSPPCAASGAGRSAQ